MWLTILSNRGWWRAFVDMGQRQRAAAELEAGAAEIRQYHQNLVPGLLQTAEYAKVRMMSGRDLYEGLDTDVESRARQARQRILTRDTPPEYEGIIEEAALRRNAAPPEVMRVQLQHLAKTARRPNVHVRVLPLDAQVGDHYLPHTAFSLYRYPDPADPQTVVLETLVSDVHLRDEEDIASYKMVFGWLRDAALAEDESAALVTELADQL